MTSVDLFPVINNPPPVEVIYDLENYLGEYDHQD